MDSMAPEGRGIGLRPFRVAMIGLLLLSAALVWYDLGAREVLGRDENITIVNLDQPVLKGMLAATYQRLSGQPSNTQPLYFLLEYAFLPLVGRSAFMLRFLSSVFALLGVVFTGKLGEALFSREVGLLGALFTALLPLHLRYAQIARPYTLLAFLSIASAYFLVRSLETNRALHWAGFVVTATSNFYTHFNALFVLAAEALFTSVVWLVGLLSLLKKRQTAERLVGPVLAFLLVGVLCLPGLVRLLGLPWVGATGEGESSIQVVVQLGIPFFHRFLNEIGLTTAWLRGLLLGLMGLGLAATLYHRRWQAALFCVLWLVVPFVVLSVMKSPRPFEERYVIFVPPVAFLLVAQGAIALAQMAGTLGGRWRPRGTRLAATIVISAGLALLFVPPLRLYYAANRSADRLAQTLLVVERYARPGDIVVVSPRMFVPPLDLDGVEVLYLAEHPSFAELDDLAQDYQGMWILFTTSLPPIELQEPLDQWVQGQGDTFFRFPIKAPSALAYGNLALADAEANLKDRIAVLEELVQTPAGSYGRWVRHGILADAYQSLGDLYAEQGNSDMAADYWSRAEKIRTMAPSPQ